MKVTAIKMNNVRGFQDVPQTKFSESINIFIGPNNSGKSTILNCIFHLQRPVLNKSDVTIGKEEGDFELYLDDIKPITRNIGEDYKSIIFNLQNNNVSFGSNTGRSSGGKFNRSPEQEPYNIIYPYLSKRKVAGYSNAINETNANSVTGNFTYLFSKVDRLATPQFQPAHSQYIKACNKILGFQVSSIAKGNGKQAVYFVHNMEHIPLSAMGEGVANILGLLTDLCIAENKIFLIEEPENDIHPKALKALLELISEKSKDNQFFISTHSNIVMKHLGAIRKSKVFKVSNNKPDLFKPNLKQSYILEVPNNPIDRIHVLEELGYDLFDIDLWKAWLFLEESSAEYIIRDHLIRWFIPSLKFELRTFSAGSTSKIKPKFDDFNKLFVFLYLEPAYKNRVWVYIDSGEIEKKIIDEMIELYSKSGWNKSNFNQFSEHDFEKYYPERFQNEVNRVLSIKEQKKKREEKKELLFKVKEWILENDKIAKEEFKDSASEIIIILKKIKKELSLNN